MSWLTRSLKVRKKVTGQTKSGSQAHHEQNNIKDRYVARLRIGKLPGPTLEPGLGLGLAGERLVAGSLPSSLRGGWTLHYSGVSQGERRRAGVGLLIPPQLSRHVLEFTPVNERVASLRLLGWR
ncbi:hypothetical protein L3Q82_014317 [Scortum barcoo]|uniref:Uncharacterized protein n=1 Tax=Scortum barcoo TaxID=214431 RepID=A0ACB8VX12_9TELE|nr:hypothetical protein L3Q82_014317 [Scortum barcoo]